MSLNPAYARYGAAETKRMRSLADGSACTLPFGYKRTTRTIIVTNMRTVFSSLPYQRQLRKLQASSAWKVPVAERHGASSSSASHCIHPVDNNVGSAPHTCRRSLATGNSPTTGLVILRLRGAHGASQPPTNTFDPGRKYCTVAGIAMSRHVPRHRRITRINPAVRYSRPDNSDEPRTFSSAAPQGR